MPVGQSKRSTAKTFSLPEVNAKADGRVLAGRTTKGSLARMERN